MIYDARGGPFSGPANWGAGFLPAAYQGTVFRSTGDPILDLSPPSQYVTPEQERARLDQLNWMNQSHAEKHPGSSELAARIASYELAYPHADVRARSRGHFPGERRNQDVFTG